MKKTIVTIIISVIVTIIVMLLLFAFFLSSRSWKHLPFMDDGYPDSFFPEVEELNHNGFAYSKHIKAMSNDIYYLEARFDDEKSYMETIDSYLLSHKLFKFKTSFSGGVKVIEKDHYQRFNFDEKFKNGIYVKGPITTRIIDLSDDEDYNELYLPVWICDADTYTMYFMYFHNDSISSVQVENLILTEWFNAKN